MPKGIKNINNSKQSNMEVIELLISSPNLIPREFSNNLDTSEKTTSKKILNKFIYYTPISFVKNKYYFPSTPKKDMENKNDEEDGEELVVKGRNLIDIFESM